MYCPYCGAKLNSEIVFCTQCGHQIPEPKKSNNNSGKASAEKNSDTPMVAIRETGDMNDFQSSGNTKPLPKDAELGQKGGGRPSVTPQNSFSSGEKKKKNKRLIIIILIIFVIVVGVVLGVCYALGVFDTKKTYSSSSSSSKKSSSSDEYIFCTNCNKKLESTVLFCSSCGEKIEFQSTDSFVDYSGDSSGSFWASIDTSWENDFSYDISAAASREEASWDYPEEESCEEDPWEYPEEESWEEISWVYPEEESWEEISWDYPEEYPEISYDNCEEFESLASYKAVENFGYSNEFAVILEYSFDGNSKENILAFKNGCGYWKTFYKDGAYTRTEIYMLKDGYEYIIDEEARTYEKQYTGVQDIPNNLLECLFANAEYVGTAIESRKGLSFTVDSFDIDGTEYRYYVNAYGQLQYIEIDKIVFGCEIVTAVPASYFEIPRGYIEKVKSAS